MKNLFEKALLPVRIAAEAVYPEPTYEVSGRVAVVTGGADGIGLALARKLKTRGASVAIIDRNAEALESARTVLRDGVLYLEADVRDREVMAKHIQHVVDHFGRLDIVVANAGVSPDPATIRTIEADEFERIIDVNLIGVFNTVKPAIEPIIESQGHIVLVASAAAFMPGMGMAAYMASKAGVEQLGRALRIELAPHGASAGIAYFGFVQTAFVRPLDEDPLLREFNAQVPLPLRHRATPEQAAKAVADGISRRAATTVTPAIWESIALLRGLLAAPIDRYLTADSWTHGAIRAIEQRFFDHENSAKHAQEAQ
ncbi:short-chain dehydrogenase/reductase [Smaragdicoccus niigatensis]|uniref:short-chain dehydrogenase/reductase n=1 Tax=Smaragdicoccus niigatensis TaxID=359359 RepID=UPI00039B08E4|nr:short-chain dehydrogenase/reductase [Smaragdicoccus niigatensis]